MKLLGLCLMGKWAELGATAIARLFSSLINYNINRTKVFNSTAKSHGKLVRYYALAIPQMFISAGLVTLVSHLLKATPFLATVIKLHNRHGNFLCQLPYSANMGLCGNKRQ